MEERRRSFICMTLYILGSINLPIKGFGNGGCLSLDLLRNKPWDKDSRMGKWEKQEKAGDKRHVIKPAIIVGEWSLSCSGNNDSQCKTLTLWVIPLERWQNWGIGIPIAIRAASEWQGLTPSYCSEQNRLSKLWRKPLDKEMQELAVERRLAHSQVVRDMGRTLMIYSTGKVNNFPCFLTTKKVLGCGTFSSRTRKVPYKPEWGGHHS